MPESESVELSAQDAARALADIPRYEEGLTGIGFAITLMAYGIASAAIGMTYEASRAWIMTNDAPWMFSFLWAPWIIAATILTGTVWHAQAIRLRPRSHHGSHDGEHFGGHGGSWIYAIAFSGLYIGLALGSQFLFANLDISPAGPIENLYVLSLFTGIIALVFRFRHGASHFITPVFWGAAFILVAAIAGHGMGLTSVPAMWWGAVAALIGYVGAGAMIAGRA